MSVAIYGAGGHARAVANICKLIGKNIYGFYDDCFCKEEEIFGAPQKGCFNAIVRDRKEISEVYLAIGNNERREESFYFLENHGFIMPTLIHPKSFIESNVVIGRGTVVCIGAILCTDVKIGEGCIINTGSTVDHETLIGNFVHLAPQVAVAGRVEIGDNVFIGIGANVADKLKVGKRSIIGAGSTVLSDVPENGKALGVWHK
jgi:sugar O-acyltransferase (sialic acid O-acetyltransferase NeuD family)